MVFVQSVGSVELVGWDKNRGVFEFDLFCGDSVLGSCDVCGGKVFSSHIEHDYHEFLSGGDLSPEVNVSALDDAFAMARKHFSAQHPELRIS